MNNSHSQSKSSENKQQRQQSMISLIENFFRVLLSIVIVIGIIFTFVSAIVKYRVYNTSGIVNAVLTPEYYSLVADQVEEAIEDCCLQLDYSKNENDRQKNSKFRKGGEHRVKLIMN